MSISKKEQQIIESEFSRLWQLSKKWGSSRKSVINTETSIRMLRDFLEEISMFDMPRDLLSMRLKAPEYDCSAEVGVLDVILSTLISFKGTLVQDLAEHEGDTRIDLPEDTFATLKWGVSNALESIRIITIRIQEDFEVRGWYAPEDGVYRSNHAGLDPILKTDLPIQIEDFGATPDSEGELDGQNYSPNAISLHQAVKDQTEGSARNLIYLLRNVRSNALKRQDGVVENNVQHQDIAQEFREMLQALAECETALRSFRETLESHVHATSDKLD